MKLGSRLGQQASLTAASVARIRATLDRPASPTGDPDGGRRLAETLPVPWRIRRTPLLGDYLKGRTRYFDQAVMDATTTAGQVVMVGAGYDDRAMRFRTPGVQFVEVDHPSTQADKLRRLQRLGVDVSDVRYVPADLAQDQIEEKLASAVDPEVPATFVCEALVPYLPPERVERLLRGLASTPKTAILHLDAPVEPEHPVGRAAVLLLRLGLTALGEPIRTLLPAEALTGLLVGSGWAEDRRTTGRDLGMPRVLWDTLFVRLSVQER